MALAAATVTMLVAWAIYHSRFGAGLFAIHDDEDAAEVMGVPTYRYKLMALAISCALAGVAGGIHALFLSYVTVGEMFTITVPLTVVLMSVLGGTRHWAGPAVGAVAITGARSTLHRRRSRRRRQGDDRRDPDRGDPVHAGRHPVAPAAAVSHARRAGGRRFGPAAVFAVA